MSFPQLPASLGPVIEKYFPGFWDWYIKLMTFLVTKLDTKGDIRLLTAGRGFYMISPNGTKYYVTVNNAGTLTVTPE